MLTLSIEKRNIDKSLKAIRKEGKIPAVFYGPKEKTTAISIPLGEFNKVWKEAGESTVITLRDAAGQHEALIHDVDFHPVTGIPRHADFYIIEKGKKVQVATPLEFVGESAAVKDLGGTLVKVLHELEIEAMPKDLPHSLSVDISALTTMESQILAKDIVLPSGVELIGNPEEVVASVAQKMEEIVEEAPRDISDIEISEERGKKEEEGAEEAAQSQGEEK